MQSVHHNPLVRARVAEYSKFLRDELKTKLKTRGLSVTGLKHELVERLAIDEVEG